MRVAALVDDDAQGAASAGRGDLARHDGADQDGYERAKHEQDEEDATHPGRCPARLVGVAVIPHVAIVVVVVAALTVPRGSTLSGGNQGRGEGDHAYAQADDQDDHGDCAVANLGTRVRAGRAAPRPRVGILEAGQHGHRLREAGLLLRMPGLLHHVGLENCCERGVSPSSQGEHREQLCVRGTPPGAAVGAEEQRGSREAPARGPSPSLLWDSPFAADAVRVRSESRAGTRRASRCRRGRRRATERRRAAGARLRSEGGERAGTASAHLCAAGGAGAQRRSAEGATVLLSNGAAARHREIRIDSGRFARHRVR